MATKNKSQQINDTRKAAGSTGYMNSEHNYNVLNCHQIQPIYIILSENSIFYTCTINDCQNLLKLS